MNPILYMAPIRGVTNAIYRNEYSRYFQGYDFAVTPFINSCITENSKSKALRDLFTQRNSTEFEIIPQILGNDNEGFISLANVMFDMGYHTINWNIGCPHKRVTNKMRGAGLLPSPEKIVALLEEIIPSIQNKLSLKVRLGKENPDELSLLLPLLDDFPLEEIIIHPRTAVQMYSGEADVQTLQEILSLTKHRVVYNGDIDSPQKFESLKEILPSINRWMIGRSGISNPFLPEHIKNLHGDSQISRLTRFVEFHEAIFSAYQIELNGPAHLLAKMKETWLYWSQLFLGGRKLLSKISKTKNISHYRIIVDNFFHTDPKILL